MLKEESFYISSGMNKNSLLYIGVFLAGAIITPLYLSMFNSGDKSQSDAAAAAGFTEPEDSTILTTPESQLRPGQSFAPRDSQEVIENDYAVSPEISIPTALPQYATNQPTVPSYPNYGAIPPVSLVIPETTTPRSVPSLDEEAIAPQANPEDRLGVFTQDLAENVFIPPANRPDPNAIAPEPFGSEAIAPKPSALDAFLGNNKNEEECSPDDLRDPWRGDVCG